MSIFLPYYKVAENINSGKSQEKNLESNKNRSTYNFGNFKEKKKRDEKKEKMTSHLTVDSCDLESRVNSE